MPGMPHPVMVCVVKSVVVPMPGRGVHIPFVEGEPDPVPVFVLLPGPPGDPHEPSVQRVGVSAQV